MISEDHVNKTDHPPLSRVLTGGLILNGELSANTVVDHAVALGLPTCAAARAVNDLIDRGLISVLRDGSDGKLIATPSMDDLSMPQRIGSVVAFLANAKGVANA